MKLPISLLSATVAALITTANAASCRHEDNGAGGTTFFAGADDVPNIPEVCGKLWKNLDKFNIACFLVTNASCGQGKKSKGHLHWTFTVVTGLCNTGMVESAWWEATKNDYGHISC